MYAPQMRSIIRYPVPGLGVTSRVLPIGPGVLVQLLERDGVVISEVGFLDCSVCWGLGAF